MPTLIKFDGNCSDEFDVKGFQLVDDMEAEKIIKAIEALEYPQEFYFGSNDILVFDSAGELLHSLKFEQISSEEAKIIEKNFLEYNDEFGWTPIEQIKEVLSEELYIRIWDEEEVYEDWGEEDDYNDSDSF